MATFKYLPRYQYDGPTHSNPLLEELSEEEVQRNHRLFIADLESHFTDLDGHVDVSENGVVSISAELSQRECDDIVAGYLRNLYLVADKIAD